MKIVCLRLPKFVNSITSLRCCRDSEGSRMMLKRLSLFVTVLLLVGPTLWAAGFGPEFLVRLDLNDRLDFDRASELGLNPVFRWGNEFYVVIDGATLATVADLGIPHALVDTEPFESGHYYTDRDAPSKRTDALSALGAQKLDTFDGQAVWKSEAPVKIDGLSPGDGPYEITGKEVPLTYCTPLVSTSGVAVSDPILDSIVARISEDSVEAIDTRLMDFQTRYVYTDSNDMAQEYIRQKFLSYGYTDVTTDAFYPSGWPAHNVICTKTGTEFPDKVIIIGAHYDSYNTQSDPMIFAPGADDNGSGTVGVLEAARALANVPTDKTIIFIAFDAEEIGLVGSDYFAGVALASGMDIELMLNMDMIGYDPNESGAIFYGTNSVSQGYADLAVQLTDDYTNLYGYSGAAGGSSDHYPFAQRGYRFVYAEESEFNTPGWHTNIDIISRLNIPYWTDVVRSVCLTAYATSQSPPPIEQMQVWDVGDGASLRVDWQALSDPHITGYRVMYGLASGDYIWSVDIPGGSASTHTINGLTEGTTYYVAVAAMNSAGWTSVAMPEASLDPQSQPRVPANFAAETEYQRIDVSWNASVELDFDHYELYRGPDELSLTLYQPNLTASSYSDGAVSAMTRYYYQVRSVDQTANTSALSDIVSAVPATFDQGTLVFDLTASTTGNPTEQQQDSVYNAMFDAYPHGYYQYLDYNDPVDKSILGQYQVLYWIDDDLSWEHWPEDHWAKLNWYLSYGNSVVIEGWQTPNELSSDFRYDRLRISDIDKITSVDCVGGIGEAGFPSVIFDTAKVVAIFTPWDGKLGQIWTMTQADASAEVFLRYNSATDDPVREALPVGIRRTTGGAKLALISLPLYYMREADAKAMISALSAWFDLPPADPGDLNGDGSIDVLDLSNLVDVIFAGSFPGTGYNTADVNGDCEVNVLDLVYMIDYLFRGGPAPLAGCVF
jgi:aminopeptidase YwaD